MCSIEMAATGLQGACISDTGALNVVTNAPLLPHPQTEYGILQCVVLLLLLLRFLAAATFQPRLAVIPATLLAAVAPLAHLLVTLAPLVCMIAMALVVMCGASSASLSSFGSGMWLLLKCTVTLGFGDLGPAVELVGGALAAMGVQNLMHP